MLLIFFCSIGIVAIHQVDKEIMLNKTDTALINSYQNISERFKINPNETSFEGIITNIAFKFADVLFYTTIQVTRVSAKLAIENPQINFRLILNLVILSLLLMIAIPLINIGLIIYVLIKDFIDERKYKKEIRKLKNGI